MVPIKKYLEAFDRMMELSKYLVYSKNISYNELKILFLSSLTSFSHSFGNEEDINFIIDEAYKDISNIGDILKKPILISNLYRYSDQKKKKSFLRIESFLEEFFKSNNNPILRLRALDIFFISINSLYLKSDPKIRESICKELTLIKKEKIKLIESQIRSKELLDKYEKGIEQHITSLSKGVLSDRAKEEIIISLNNLKDDKEKESIMKFITGSSLFLKQIESPKETFYLSLNKRYYDLLHSFDYDSFNIETAKFFLYVLSAVRRITGGSTVTENLEKEEEDKIDVIFESSDKKRRACFMFQLGFLNAIHSEETLSKLDFTTSLKNTDRLFFLYGALCAKEGILPPNDFSIIHEDRDIWDIDLQTKDYLTKINSDLTIPPNWDNFINLFRKICKIQPSLLPQLISCLIIIRAIKKQPDLLKGTVNIEYIARELNSSFADLTSNKDFIDNFLWLLKILYSSFPTSQNIITEYRTTAWNWYKEIAEITNKENIELYKGIEKQMIYYFHDSPGPFHLEIIEAYCEFLMTDDDFSYNRARDLLNRVNISIPRDYVKKFGTHLERVQYNSQKLLNIFREVYGSSSTKLLFEKLRNSTMERDLEIKLIRVLNKLSKYNLRSKEDITQKLISRNEIFSPEDYSLGDKIIILRDLSEVSEAITKDITRESNSETVINLIAIQNCIEGISYRFLFELINNSGDMGQKQMIDIFSSGLKLIRPLMSNYLRKETSNLIEDASDNKIDDLRLHALLKRAEKTINNASSWYLSSVQAKAKIMPCLKKEIADAITADIIRETPLFPFSELILKLLARLSVELKIEKDHITNIGDNEGTIVYVPKDLVKEYKFNGREILVTEDIDTHADLPVIRGIITKIQHPPLSHIALMARERKIPWYSPLTNEFERIKLEAIRNNNSMYHIVVFIGRCYITQIKTAKHKEQKKQIAEVDLLRDVDKTKWLIGESEYKIETAGSKAYHLSLLSKLLQDRVPRGVTLTFGFFQDLIDKDEELLKEIEYLSAMSSKYDKKDVEERILKIKDRINKIKIEPSKIKEIETAIKELFNNVDSLIVRSSTNAEDLAGHSAAGVYESILTNKKNLHKTILEVFSSFYTIKAWEDRRFAGFNERTCHMAVIIQELVHADYSFVVHTVSPLTYNKNEILIEIVPGLGESLVSGEPQFMGAAHQFVYDKHRKTIKRLAYLTKSMKKTLQGDVIIEPKSDIFQDLEIPIGVLKRIFQDSETIEKDLPKLKYGLNKSLPQDIEGLAVVNGIISKATSKNMSVYYVQTRNQYIPKIKNTFSKKKEKIIKEDSKTVGYKLKPNNTLSEKVYTLPRAQFGLNKNVNLIEILKRAIKETVGEGKMIIQPNGSVYYLSDGKKMFWDRIKDLDILLYCLDAKTKYDSYKIEKIYLNKIREAFQRIAKEEGLTVHSTAIPKYLESAIFKAKSAREKSEKITFGTDFNAETFFARIGLNIKTAKKEELKASLVSAINKYLATKKISDNFNGYYSFKFDKNSDYPNLVISSFLKAFLEQSRLYAPVFWDWNKTIEVLYDIFSKLKLITITTKKDFIENIIKKHLEYNLIPQIEPFNSSEIEKNYPGMEKKILEGWTQAVFHYLNSRGKITSKDIIIRDHIDDGSISSILSLFIGLKDEKDKSLLLKIIQQADELKVPNPTKDHLDKRLNGELYGPQLFLMSIRKILKPVKEGMTDAQAVEFLRKEPISGMNVMDLLLKITKDIAAKEYSFVKRYCAEPIKQLENEGKKVLAMKSEEVKNLFEYSEFKQVAAINDNKNLKDLEIKYLLLDKNTSVLVQYQEIKNNANKLKGYRYYNVGVNPLSKKISLLGLMEILSAVEMIFNTSEESKLSRQNLWVGHSRPDIMITGPSCGDLDSCSLIPPNILIELIELFLAYKKLKNLEYHALNYEKMLPEEFQKSIHNFLYEKEVIQKLESAAKQILEINPNSEITNELGSFLIQQVYPKIRFISCGNADLRISPISYFTNPSATKDPWWDKVPKGLNSWCTYYGDDKSIKRFTDMLRKNENNVTFEYLCEDELRKVSMKRIGYQISGITNRKEALFILKEVIRRSKFLSEREILNEAYVLLGKFDCIEDKELNKKISMLFNKMSSLSKKRLLQKICQNVKKICSKK